MNEVLLLEAIAISKNRQVFSYYYLGHYHKVIPPGPGVFLCHTLDLGSFYLL
jgi:hypothetical protein